MAMKTVEQGSAEIFRKTINDNFTEISEKNDSVDGEILTIKDDISKIKILTGDGPPSEQTAGSLGQSYLDTTGMKVYYCVKISGSTYTWKISAGNSAIISEEPPENPEKGDVWYQII